MHPKCTGFRPAIFLQWWVRHYTWPEVCRISGHVVTQWHSLLEQLSLFTLQLLEPLQEFWWMVYSERRIISRFWLMRCSCFFWTTRCSTKTSWTLSIVSKTNYVTSNELISVRTRQYPCLHKFPSADYLTVVLCYYVDELGCSRHSKGNIIDYCQTVKHIPCAHR